jgi:hypothetical protein
MTINKLKLNDDKTEFLVLSTSKKQHKIPERPLSIGTSKITRSASARNLGVTLDSSLNMKKHISSVCKSSYLHLKNIGKLRKYLTKETTEKLIHAFISPVGQ